tara:strand:- start:705 stop:935 length:231 start_codon:yes stop_codon:yes gene_type:complete
MFEIYHGVLSNSREINLPEDWSDLVDLSTITVCVTPIGAHQDIIVKGVQGLKVILQAKAGMPINCYYQIVANRVEL